MKNILYALSLSLFKKSLKPLKTRLLLVLVQTSFYRFLVLNILPRIRFSTYYTKMRGWKYHDGYDRLLPGDIILTKDKKKLSTHIIGGEWAHAGICISRNTVFECAEMTSRGFTKSTFADMCFEADRVRIIRCRDWDQDYIKKVIKKCLEFEDADYDVSFSFNNDFLYCSELIYESDFERRLDVSLEDLALLGNPYISPTGLNNAKNVDIVWDSSRLINSKNPEIRVDLSS